jgi:hypothetical protein
MTTNSFETDRVCPRKVFTRGGRYAAVTVLTSISVACLTLPHRHVHWWVTTLCVAVGLSLPLGIARVLPSEPQDRDKELHYRSYWSRVGSSYVYVVVIAVALILILPLLGLFLFELLSYFGVVLN